MAEKAQHTPLPFKKGVVAEGTHTIINGENMTIAHVFSQRDTAFIVRACNSHDDLLETCKTLVHILEHNHPGYLKVAEANNAIAKTERKT